MPLVDILTTFRADVAQCDHLIATAHGADAGGQAFFSVEDRRQITVAAFLNLFVAWETFLESSLVELMIGSATLSGTVPVRYVSPLNSDRARVLVIGVQRYFDYGNHDYVRRVVGMFFEDGYPFEPHLSSINSDLADLRTMRNASAHVTSSTQTALEALVQRVLAIPHPGIDLYSFLTMIDPRSTTGETVFLAYKGKLIVTAELICQG